MNSNYYVTPPNQEAWQPPIFRISANMSVRALSWRTLLYDLLFAVWGIRLPEGWHATPFRYQLFGFGSVGIGYSERLAWVYGTYGVERVDWQYTPVLYNVTNILLPDPVKCIRGLNGTILHVHDDWTGYDPLITYTAKLLAEIDKGVEVNLKQFRMGKLVGTKNKKDKETLETAINQTMDGDPVAYVSDKLLNEDGTLNVAHLIGDLGREYAADKLMETRLMIIKDYLTRIGVRTVGMEKREHLLNQEINENNDETGAEPAVVMSSLAEDLALLKGMGLDIDIRPRFDYSGAGIGGGEQNAQK